MNMQVGVGFVLMMGSVSEAAEPVVPARAPAAQSAPTPKPAAPITPASRPPLDLRVGDIRKYMMPNEYLAAISAPDADRDTIVVEANRELLPMKSLQPIPGGIATPFWALAHPLKAWRILLPDVNAPEDGPTIDKVPPPIFRWGP